MASGTLQAEISLMDIVWRVTTNAGVGGLYFLLGWFGVAGQAG
jgi:hypothetical protein